MRTHFKIRKLESLFVKACNRFGIKTIVPRLPFNLMIEPTNACNLRCPTCPTGAGKLNRPKRSMKLEEFTGIVDQVKGYVENITLWNYGEPFLNKDLLNMVRYAVSNDIRITVSTNGEFFRSKDFCREIVGTGLDHLIICLDGADQETLSKFRKGSNFEEIVSGIQMIRNAKNDLESKTPSIELQFIVMKHNEHQKEHMRQWAKKLGADLYLEKTVGIDFNDRDFQEMAKDLLPSDLSDGRYDLDEEGNFMLKGTISNNCSWLNTATVINSDGSVVPCCYDLYSKHIMGNVFATPLKEIWKGENYRTFRKKVQKNRKNISICNICSEGRYNISEATSMKNKNS